jgi:hypothetical protein
MARRSVSFKIHHDTEKLEKLRSKVNTTKKGQKVFTDPTETSINPPKGGGREKLF